MDGLMIDTERPVQACCLQAAERLGVVLDVEFYERALVGRGWAECDAALLARFGTGFPLDRFKVSFGELWDAHVAAHGISTKPGLHELLTFLKGRLIPFAVATSTHRREAEFCLEKAGIRDRFSILVAGDEVERGKPEPDIYLEAASRLGVAPRQCVALEDSNAGVLAAARAGMLTLMVPDPPRVPSGEAGAAAHAILTSLFEARNVLRQRLDTSADSTPPAR
jgi:HAD superfamily hydrolase (TIGR01509 family)